MATPTRTYIVASTTQTGVKPRLVRTISPSHALRHVASRAFSVSVASQEDLERWLPEGVKVERPRDDEPQQADLIGSSDGDAP